MFIVHKILHPSLTFLVEANVYPVGEPLRTHFEGVFIVLHTYIGLGSEFLTKTNTFEEMDTVFVNGKNLKPSLIFLGEARTLQIGSFGCKHVPTTNTLAY
jgi:hypothetical protein